MDFHNNDDDDGNFICEHCHQIANETFHTCVEGQAASRQRSDNFNHNWFGGGGVRKRTITVEVVTPPTDMSLSSVLTDFSTYYEKGVCEGHSDLVLNTSWRVIDDR